MSPDLLVPLPLLAETTRSVLRWHLLLPAWVIVLVIVPLVLGLGCASTTPDCPPMQPHQRDAVLLLDLMGEYEEARLAIEAHCKNSR